MSKLTLASVNPALPDLSTTQWAHDIRNALAVMSLHVEILERLSGAGGRKAASAAQAVMKRTAGMCNATLAARADQNARRRGFDLVKVVREIRSILEPIAPEGFEIRIADESPCVVIGDASDVFRIIFNLVQNAVSVARGGQSMSHVDIAIIPDRAHGHGADFRRRSRAAESSARKIIPRARHLRRELRRVWNCHRARIIRTQRRDLAASPDAQRHSLHARIGPRARHRARYRRHDAVARLTPHKDAGIHP